jgi:hypothetical protein
MDFRWVAGITIWTMLAGPAFVGLSQRPAQTLAPQVKSSPAINDAAPAAGNKDVPMIATERFYVSWYLWDGAHGWVMASRIMTESEKQELVEELAAIGCRAKIERLLAAP